MVDFSAEYSPRYEPVPAPPVALNTPRQRLINAAAIVCHDEAIDFIDRWELEKVITAAAQGDDETANYYAGLSITARNRLFNTIVRASYHETFVRPSAPAKPRLSGLTSRAVLEQLRSAGIFPHSVKFMRGSQQFNVYFQSPELQNIDAEGTESGEVWGRRIAAAFDGVVITATFDTVATWRPRSPILYASVYIVLE